MYLEAWARHAASADRSRQRMRRIGHTPNGRKLWTEEEDALCLEYGHDYKLLAVHIPDRSYAALRARCGHLGIRPKRRIVSARERTLLRRLYPRATTAELREAFPGRSLVRIQQIARYYGFKRCRAQLTTTGFPVIDEIRQRCHQLNYSMVDLDNIARTKKYFQKACWFNRQTPNPLYVLRAVEALGGKMTVEWDEL